MKVVKIEPHSGLVFLFGKKAMPCSPDHLWTYKAQPGLAHEIFQFQPPGCWDYMGFYHVQPIPNFHFISHTPIPGDALS